VVTRHGEDYPTQGTNFSGTESDCRAPLGLWEKSLEYFLGFVADNGFTSTRVPVSYEVVADLTLPVQGCVPQEPTFHPGVQVARRLDTGPLGRNAREELDRHGRPALYRRDHHPVPLDS
jgi:hypothetical protein